MDGGGGNTTCQGPEVVKRSMLSDRGTVQGTVPFVAGMWSGELGRQREARVFCRGGAGADLPAGKFTDSKVKNGLEDP